MIIRDWRELYAFSLLVYLPRVLFVSLWCLLSVVDSIYLSFESPCKQDFTKCILNYIFLSSPNCFQTEIKFLLHVSFHN